MTEAALGRRLVATEHTAIHAALVAASSSGGTPVLPAVVDAFLCPEHPYAGSTRAQLAEDGRYAGHGLARLVRGDLTGLFDGPSPGHTAIIRPIGRPSIVARTAVIALGSVPERQVGPPRKVGSSST